MLIVESYRTWGRIRGLFPYTVLLKIAIIFYISGLALNEFIQHFEPAHFSLEDLGRQVRRQSQRTRRSINTSAFSQSEDLNRRLPRYQTPVTFNLTAHNRLFQVSLVEDAESVFAPDATFENTHGIINYDREAKIYSGFLQGESSDWYHNVTFLYVTSKIFGCWRKSRKSGAAVYRIFLWNISNKAQYKWQKCIQLFFLHESWKIFEGTYISLLSESILSEQKMSQVPTGYRPFYYCFFVNQTAFEFRLFLKERPVGFTIFAILHTIYSV